MAKLKVGQKLWHNLTDEVDTDGELFGVVKRVYRKGAVGANGFGYGVARADKENGGATALNGYGQLWGIRDSDVRPSGNGWLRTTAKARRVKAARSSK